MMPSTLRGKRATILGFGREGIALARFLVREGAIVTISDAKPAEQLQEQIARIAGLPVRLSLGENRVDDTLSADVVFVSPGVPRTLPALVAARARGIPISSEAHLFLQRCPGPVIGITGSSGKTTTTSLVGAMLRQAGQPVLVGGNIGQTVIDRLDQVTPATWVVLELSSFQLLLVDRSPSIAAVTNVTPNHLDVHPSMEDYIEAKANIFRYQQPRDWTVLNAENPITRGYASRCPGMVAWFGPSELPAGGATVVDNWIVVDLAGRREQVMPVTMIPLRGRHNLENVLAATAIAAIAGVPPAAITAAVQTFPGVEHRLETVRVVDGVRYVNDSIATAPERTIAALRSFDEPIVLLLGGREKHLPLADLADLAVARCRRVVVFGEAAPMLAAAIAAAQARADDRRDLLVRAASLEEAVRLARAVARPGDVVLLSPACTSFDAFRDYEARGRAFKEIVNSLTPAEEVMP